MTTPPPVDARPHGEIEAEVGIGQEEDSDVVADQSGGLSSMITGISPEDRGAKRARLDLAQPRRYTHPHTIDNGALDQALCFGWLPPYIQAALKKHPAASRHFEALAPSQRRRYLAWSESAKREETKRRRLQEAIRLLAAGKELGLK